MISAPDRPTGQIQALTPLLSDGFYVSDARQICFPEKKIKYHGIILKLSGEVLRGARARGDRCRTLEKSATVKEIHSLGVQICLVIGGR